MSLVVQFFGTQCRCNK